MLQAIKKLFIPDPPEDEEEPSAFRKQLAKQAEAIEALRKTTAEMELAEDLGILFDD